MKNFYFILLFILFCINKFSEAANYYCDPANGNMSNNGSLSTPWSSLEDVMNAGKTFISGDVIYLMNGNHGYPVITGSNTGNVTITKYSGHNPEMRRLVIDGAGFWTIKEVKVTSNGATIANQNIPLEHPVWPLSDNALVSIRNSSSNIIIDGCYICSVDDNSVWTTTDDWNYHAWNGIETGGGSNITIQNNHIKNINFGSWGGCTNYIYRNNVVENFGGDGIQFGTNYEIIENNVFKDCYEINGNHDDCMQGMHTYEVGIGTQIRGNTLINCTDPNRNFIGDAQGIGLFDRLKYDYVVENNLVVVDHWHGITLLGAINCKIINNTVLDANDINKGPAWIQIGNSSHPEDATSSGNLIRNNLCNIINNDGDVGTVDNNIIVSLSEYNTYFVDYTNNDYHTKAGSPAIDAGISTEAPSVDIDGVSRPQGNGYDIGCYEYSGEIVDVTGVTITPSTLSIEIGATSNLTAEISPANATYKSVTWSSSNPLVATINNGTVTALSAGSSVITVTTVDGGYTATCNVTVTIPAGDYNLAISKPVTTTSDDGTHTGDYLVDGNVSDVARWSADGMPQSAEIDLGVNCNISSLELYTYQSRAYQYTIEAKPDGGSYSTIVDRSSNTSTSQPITDNVSTTARYIKITVTGAAVYTGTWISLNELKVMGTIAQSGLQIDYGTVSGISTSNWTTVNLSKLFTSPVIIATPIYDNTTTPCVTRINNITSTSFDVKLDAASSGSASGIDVYYMVIEEGSYANPKIEAIKVVSDGTNRKSSWGNLEMEQINPANSYTNPVVLGQVMSYNDNNWSAFWSSNGSQSTPATSSAIYVGKHVAEDPNTTRANETLGVIIIESGSGMIGNVEFTAALGSDIVQSVTNAPPYNYLISGITNVDVAVVTQAAMDGGDGSFSLLYGSNPISASSINVAVDEDNLNDSERGHTDEQVGYIVLGEGTSNVPVSSVSISSSTQSLDEGETSDLDETVLPVDATNKSVVWSSSNTAIATVNSSGLVTAIAEGNAVITVTTNDGGYTATCNVTVSSIPVEYTLNPIADAYVRGGVNGDNNYGTAGTIDLKYTGAIDYLREGYLKFDLTGIPSSVTSAVLRLYVSNYGGNTTQTYKLVSDDSWTETGITYNNSPSAGSVIGSSSVVSAGSYIEIDIQAAVEAEAGGTLSIQLTANEDIFTGFDSREGTNKPELVILAGGAQSIHVTGVSLSSSSLSINEGETAQLTKTISPVDATDQSVVWTSSNTSIATINSSGLITAVSAGNATITVTTNDGGYTASCSVVVNSLQPFTLNPVADAYVRGGTYADNNYGTSTLITMKNSATPTYERKGFVKFDLTGVQTTVGSAILRFYVSTLDMSMTCNLNLLNDDSWTETGITYNNAPSAGTSFGSQPISTTGYIEFDVTSTVNSQAGGMFSLQTSVNLDATANIESREGTYKPELVITPSSSKSKSVKKTSLTMASNFVKVYPNPLTGQFITIEAGGFSTEEDVYVSIFNMNGQQLLNEKMDNYNSTDRKLVICCNDIFSNGVYFIQVTDKMNIKVEKLIISN